MSPLRRLIIVGSVAAAVGLWWYLGLQDAHRKGTGWEYAGELTGNDGIFVRFVRVEPGFEKSPATYKEAVSRFCPGQQDCLILAFFLRGDAVPPRTTRGEFFGTGGFQGYKPLAVYWSLNGFTHWDCDRAGLEAAPVEALCGPGVKEQYIAVLDIGARDGWTAGCGLPRTNGRQVVERFVAHLSTDRRKQLLDAYYKMATTGPDDPSRCGSLRARIESKAAHARRVLQAAGSGAQ